jgi:hypothetical protein
MSSFLLSVRRSSVCFTVSDGGETNVVDNDKRSKTTKRQFTDDCGAWQKSSLKTHYYLKSNVGNFEYIYKKQSIFFKRKNGKMVPLNPQPDLDSLVVLQRYHSKIFRTMMAMSCLC